MNHPVGHKKLYNIIIIAFFAIVAISLFAISVASSSLRPILYGICIAYIFKPMCNMFDKWFYLLYSKKLPIPKARKAAHATSIVATYLTWFVIIYLFVSIVLLRVVSDIQLIGSNINVLVDNVSASLDKLLSEHPVLQKYYQIAVDEVIKYVEQNTDKITSIVGDLANGVISGVIGTVTLLFDLFVGVIVSVYILIGRRKLGAQAKLITKSVFSKKASELIIQEVRFADKMFSKYFVGRIIDSLVIGIVCFVGCLIFSIPNMLLVSVIVGVANIIPFFGPYIGLLPAGVIVFAHEPIKALILVVMMLIIQQIDGNIIWPKIQGTNTGLSSFWVLFAILLFGGLFGFFGMIIGVPIFAVIYDIFGKLMRFCLQKRGEHEELSIYEKEYLTFDDQEAANIFKRKMAEWKEEYQKKRKNRSRSDQLDDAAGRSKPKKKKRENNAAPQQNNSETTQNTQASEKDIT